MRISKTQLSNVIRRRLMSEAKPTFGLRVGDAVRHTDDSFRGVGTVLFKSNQRDRTVLVKWADGTTQRHDPSTLRLVPTP